MFLSPIFCAFRSLTCAKESPALASRRDDDDRLPIHWAVSYNHPDIVDLLMVNQHFDPDVQVLYLATFIRREALSWC